MNEAGVFQHFRWPHLPSPTANGEYTMGWRIGVAVAASFFCCFALSSISLFHCLSLSHCFTILLFLTVSLSLSNSLFHCLSLSHCFTISLLSQSHWLNVSPFHYLTVSQCLTVPLSHCLAFSLFHCNVDCDVSSDYCDVKVGLCLICLEQRTQLIICLKAICYTDIVNVRK